MHLKMNNELIKVKNLNKTFKNGDYSLNVIKCLNLSLFAGESISIMGDSGSGKSTLLNIISGLDSFNCGDLFWNGINVSNFSIDTLSNKRRNFIGYIFQSFYLIPELNAYENLLLISKISGKSFNEEKYDYLHELLEVVGLKNKTYNPIQNLSGGEKQRLCIARSLVNKPKVILADEPTGNLDKNSSKLIMDLLFRLIKNYNKSMIFVTHNKSYASLCDKALRLSDGCLDK